MTDQLTQGVTYCHSLFYATQPAEALAEFLVDSTGGEMARVFLSSSGSEATYNIWEDVVEHDIEHLLVSYSRGVYVRVTWVVGPERLQPARTTTTLSIVIILKREPIIGTRFEFKLRFSHRRTYDIRDLLYGRHV